MVYSFNPKEPKTGKLLFLIVWLLELINFLVPSYSRAILWSTIELGVALICACLPTYRPLLPKTFGLPSTVRGWYTSLLSVTRSRGSTKATSNNDLSGYNKFDHRESFSMDKVHLTQAIGGNKSRQNDELGNSCPLHGIAVESRVEVV